MLTSIFVVLFLAGCTVRLGRWVRSSDPRQVRIRETRKQKARVAVRRRAGEVPVLSGYLAPAGDEALSLVDERNGS